MSTAELRQCTRCRNLIDPEELFCPNCGTEAPMHEHEAAAHNRSPDWEVYTFGCDGCGASMSFDARAGALRCPFCGATEVHEKPSAEGVTYPERLIPFDMDQAAAEQRFRGWLGKGFWRPGDLKKVASISGVKALFLPCWCFRGRTEACWAADVGASTRSGWRPRSGEQNLELEGVLVPASHGLKGAELAAIQDFAFGGLVQTDHEQLDGALVESFGLTRKGARERAREAFNAEVEAAVTRTLGVRKIRNFHSSVLLSDVWSEPILLPIWIFAYRYKGDPYRFVMNGQTGKATGKAPFSYRKLAAIIAAVLVALGGLTALVSCAGGLAAMFG